MSRTRDMWSPAVSPVMLLASVAVVGGAVVAGACTRSSVLVQAPTHEPPPDAAADANHDASDSGDADAADADADAPKTMQSQMAKDLVD